MTTTEQLYKIYLQHPSICTDTRKLQKGDLFFALKGENFNGNVYAEKAIAQGAAFAVVDDSEFVKSDRYLLVEDVLTLLQNLATLHRSKFDIPVIAISGSNGKTTTKELVAGILGSKFKTHFTKGNFNNHIGVPLTLLAMPADTEMAIIEMGANHHGEIADLCTIAKPTHGLLTNVGQAHIEGFGSFEGVKQAKSELYHYLAAHNGLVFINLEEPFLANLAACVDKKIEYKIVDKLGEDKDAFEIKCLNSQPTVALTYPGLVSLGNVIMTNLAGRHNLQNISTAITIGRFFKVPYLKMYKFLESYKPENNRSQWLEKDGVHFLLDAYNANPSSMEASLLSFSQQESKQKLAILGDMLELGESADEHHLAIAKYAQSLNLENIFLVGALFKDAARRLNIQHFKDASELKNTFDIKKWNNYKVLIKGSRGIALEKLLD